MLIARHKEQVMKRSNIVIAVVIVLSLVLSTAAGCSLFKKDADVTVEMERG